VPTTCFRRDWRVVPRISAVTHITDWLAVSSRLPHAELAADTDNCCRKHQYSRHSIYPHCSCTPLPLCTEPHLKSPVTVMVSLRLWWSGPPNARRSATAHFPWQLHVPGTASRQLLWTRRHFLPSGAAWRHGCLNWHWRDTDFILRLHFISFAILVTL